MTTLEIILSVLLAISVSKNISDRILKKRLFGQVDKLKAIVKDAINLAKQGKTIAAEALQLDKDITEPNPGSE